MVKDIPVPALRPGAILIQMRACGLCGSDLEKIYGKYGMRSGRLGHEPAGEIVSMARQTNDFQEGDRVFVTTMSAVLHAISVYTEILRCVPCTNKVTLILVAFPNNS